MPYNFFTINTYPSSDMTVTSVIQPILLQQLRIQYKVHFAFCVKVQSRIDKYLNGCDLIEHHSKYQQYIQENSYEISPRRQL